MQRSVVVLPQPDGPSSVKMRPCSTEKLASRTTRTRRPCSSTCSLTSDLTSSIREELEHDLVEPVGLVVLRLVARVLQLHELHVGQELLHLVGEVGRREAVLRA